MRATQVSYPKTRTVSGYNQNSTPWAEAYDGDHSTTDGKFLRSSVQGDGGQSISSSFKVTLTRPVTTKKIDVWWYGWGREGAGGYGDVKGHRSDTLKVNGSTIITDTSMTQSIGNLPTEQVDNTVRTGVNEVFVEQYAWDDADGSLNPRSAYNYLHELEIWAVV